MRVRVCLALWIAIWVSAPAHAGKGLSARLDAALRSDALRGSQVGALVVSRDDGRVLYERNPDRALIPASNMKVLTAVAVLSAFGPTHRFVTELKAGAAPDASGAVDTLAVVAGGDPALTSEQLWRLAADLRRLGLRRVRNGLLFDVSTFDDERWHPVWGPISSRAYHAPVHALSANYGAFVVRVEAGARAGEPVVVTLDPPISYLRLRNTARTGGRGESTSLVVDRRAADGFEEVVVSGVVRAGSQAKDFPRSVVDPVSYAGAILRMQLAANGIAVEGADRRGRVAEGLASLLEFEGKSVAQIVRLFLKYSNNAIGETLVKALGARAGKPGSWPRGMDAMRDELVALGVAMDSVAMVDGSGLSYENRVTPRALVSALRIADDSFRFGPEFESGLPIAAFDGTLSKRTAGAAGRVRAKTGLLTRVTSLAGYAESARGEGFAFSVLVNGYRGSAEAAMGALDAFAAALVADAP